MGLITRTATVAKDRLMVCKFQNLADWYVRLIPFENKKTSIFKNSETFRKALGQGISPLSIQMTVLYHLPACQFLLTICPFQVRRVKHYKRERTITELHRAEITQHIRLNLKVSAVA